MYYYTGRLVRYAVQKTKTIITAALVISWKAEW